MNNMLVSSLGLLVASYTSGLKREVRDFPGGPVGKTLHSQCRRPKFDPWSGN